jgi:hypothetical protein
MIRPTCSQLRTQLQEIKSLKGDFDFELPKIQDTRNTTPALKLEEEIRGKIKDTLFFVRFGHLECAETTVRDKSKEELIKELEEREKYDSPEDKIHTNDSARSMLQNPDFTVINKPEKITLVRLKVKDLGFKQDPTIEQFYNRAQELGLELCPPEIGPHLRLNYQEIFKREQLKGEDLYIGMKQIIDSSGHQNIFYVHRYYSGERWLDNYWARPEHQCLLEREFIFVRK